MVDELSPLRVNAVELLRNVGAIRPVSATIAGSPLGVDHDRLAGDVTVELRLEAMNDGILVTGEVRAPWAAACRRCLTDVSGVLTAEIDELYQVDLTDPDAYAIENNQLDLAPMVRENALLELDLEQLCRPECAGLCPSCGIDRNDLTCDCDTTVTDHRWAALDGFVLDE